MESRLFLCLTVQVLLKYSYQIIFTSAYSEAVYSIFSTPRFYHSAIWSLSDICFPYVVWQISILISRQTYLSCNSIALFVWTIPVAIRYQDTAQEIEQFHVPFRVQVALEIHIIQVCKSMSSLLLKDCQVKLNLSSLKLFGQQLRIDDFLANQAKDLCWVIFLYQGYSFIFDAWVDWWLW